jgi:hypothetical protein
MASRPLKQVRVVASNLVEVEPQMLSSLDGADACREDARFVARTIQVWEERYGAGLSESDAKDIARNLSRFFDILAEWDRHTDQATP